jgi:beta-glucosidase
MTNNAPETDLESRARALLSAMTLEEKTASMSGSTPFWSGLADIFSGAYNRHTWDAGHLERLGIEGIRFSDGPRGVVIGQATTFPVSMARGASWDVDLERRIGAAMGLEASAVRANLFGGVCINLLRHPAWGRAQETYGEDSFLLGEFGVALTEGVQEHVMACVKHYALNSMENARFSVNVEVAPRALHEVYLPHFKRTVDAGAACVMSAYNRVNGQWAGHSSELLHDILKTRWGFQGFVVTDWIFGLRDAKLAALGGQDLEMPFHMHFHADLLRLVQTGEVPESRVDDAVLRMLRSQLRFEPMKSVTREVMASPAHAALAREAAQKSIVLLKNAADILPLQPSSKLAVIGTLAGVPNTGDGGSSNTVSPHIVTPLEGLNAAFHHVTHDDGSDLERAQRLARGADAVLLVVGYTKDDEGEFISPDSTANLSALFPAPRAPEEIAVATTIASGMAARAEESGAFSTGGDRGALNLRAADEALIRAVAEVHDRVIVAIMTGSAVLMNAWQDAVQGILLLWYPGMEGGHALADVLLGTVNPSAKLPFSIAADESHYPHFDRDATTITYDLWHGYRKLERDGNAAAYPFGFGLSYTTYTYSNLNLSVENDTVTVRLEVTNTGQRAGEEIVQVYVSALNSAVERPVKELKAFARVALLAGETKTVALSIPTSSLAYFDEEKDDFVLEALDYEFIAARHSADPAALRSRVRLG